MITNGFTYIAVLVFIAALLVWLQRYTKSKFFDYAPPIVLLYLITMILCTLGAWDMEATGYIATAQTAPLREVQPDGSRHPFDQFITAKTPAGRWGEPDDMVGPCVFLASHASDFVNGQILYADGGILAYIGRQPK